MKQKLFNLIALFSIIIILILGAFWDLSNTQKSESKNGEQIISLNEIQQFLEKAIEDEDLSQLPAIVEKVKQQKEWAQKANLSENMKSNDILLLLLGISCILFLLVIFLYVYFAILKPFDKMKSFASEIAAGNFNLKLDYERSNYFGAFTWAFDSMRREITKARTLEKEAIENNKVVIATLSHDIKTPIASIRAYAEGLEANLNSYENRELYLQVIMRKCDEVVKLVNDLFLHSIVDLEKLKLELERVELTLLLETMLRDLNVGKGDILLEGKSNEVYVSIDPKRFMQVLENLINNARKYGAPPIVVSLTINNNRVFIRIKDHGTGIPNEDFPFVFEKFYRGRNVKEQEGSGLGLYIAKYIMGQCMGDITFINHADGLEATLELPRIP